MELAKRKVYKPRLEFRPELEAFVAKTPTTSVPMVMRTRASDGTAAVLTPVYSWSWTVFIVLGYGLFIVPILIEHLICIFKHSVVALRNGNGENNEGSFTVSATPR